MHLQTFLIAFLLSFACGQDRQVSFVDVHIFILFLGLFYLLLGSMLLTSPFLFSVISLCLEGKGQQ